MAAIFDDFRFVLRSMARSPMFTMVAMFSVALGIDANTAIVTLIDQLLSRLLPVKDLRQLAMIWSTWPHMGNNNGDCRSSYPMYEDYQRRSRRSPAAGHQLPQVHVHAGLISFAGRL